MKFLKSEIVNVQDIPFRKRDSGALYPIESAILREYQKIKVSSGLDIYELAGTITKDPDIKKESGEQYSFQEAIRLVLTQDAIVVGKYKNEIKRAYFSTLDLPDNYLIVTCLMNTRVAQAWHVKNRKDIEKGLASEPSLIGWEIVFPDFEETMSISLLNSEGSDPVYRIENGKLIWTLQQTFRLGEDVINEIFDKVLSKADKNEELENDPDFLSEDSEIN